MKVTELQTRYDVVVLGGGPAGSTAASTLARKTLSVLIVEEQEAINFKVGETLPGFATVVLARAGFPGLLRRVPQLRCSGNRSCWGSVQLRWREGLVNPYGGGTHLDRASFDQELIREAGSAGALILRGARFQSATRSNRVWTIFLRHGPDLHSVECDSIVDCTGRKACFARSRGADRIVVDRQIAVVSVLSGADIKDDDLTTIIEATPKGWWYSARLPSQERITAFFSDGSLLSGLDTRSNEGFAGLMSHSEHIGKFLRKGYTAPHKPTVVLADTSYLTHSAGDGWCAAGDAASAIDPLASAGIVNGINAGSKAALLVLSGFKNIQDYSEEIVDKAKADIEIRQSYYRMETRWPREPFWLLRQENPLM